MSEEEARAIPATETGQFLDEKQKQLKQKIMEDLMEAFFGNIQKNQSILTHQAVIDMFGSIIIMFNREILVHFLKSFNLVGNRKDIMKNMFESIRDEVNRIIKKDMN